MNNTRLLAGTISVLLIAGLMTPAFALDNSKPNADPIVVSAGDPPAGGGANLDNGAVTIGVTNGGSLITTFDGLVGLQRSGIPASESVAVAYLGEGWGVAVPSTGLEGGVNLGAGSPGVEVPTASFTSTATTAKTTTMVPTIDAPILKVTHEFQPSASPDLFAINVKITNVGDEDIDDVQYRRSVDWDVQPTPFSEFVTVDGTATDPFFVAGGNNGFGSMLILTDTTYDIAPFPGAPDFVDSGPNDHGAVVDLSLGPLDAGDWTGFTMYYGVAESEAAADAARAAVGADMYSYGQPSSSPPEEGIPWTFILAFGDRIVGGEFLPIDSTALFLAGLTSSAVWIIPTLAGLAGAGVIIRSRLHRD